MKFSFGYFPLLLCLLTGSVCLADLGAHVWEVKWSQHLIKANLARGDNGPCVLKGFLCFSSASFPWHPMNTTCTHQEMRLPWECLIRAFLGFFSASVWTKEKVIHISQVLHPTLWKKHLLYSSLVSSPAIEHTFKVCFQRGENQPALLGLSFLQLCIPCYSSE